MPNPSWEEFTIYSRASVVSLPTDDGDLENLFTAQEYLEVDNNDGIRVDQSSTGGYSVFLFKNKNDSQESITINWDGQSNRAPSDSTVYLQIYNRNSSTWETLDSDSTSAANIDFTLTGNIFTNLSNYYDNNYWISWRVYQQAI